MPEVISADHLTFNYGGNTAVSDVSFVVSRGDYVALVGHNGSGKSTLIKLLLGILPSSSGSVSLFGQPLSHFSAWEKIGYLPQNIALFNPLFPATVFEVVALGLIAPNRFPHRFTSTDSEKVHRALAQMNMTKFSGQLIGELSGGQIQRTLLARAIVNQPDLLILDEPVSSVDAETREDFFSYTLKLNQEHTTTIILITHDIGHSVKYTNKLLFLDKKILFYGEYGQFCSSQPMTDQFGAEIQHLICGQH